MKRKVLAIALSLAILASLFVFANPVIAGANKGPENAADQAEKFTFWMDYVQVGDPVYLSLRLNHNNNVQHAEALWYYDIIDSTFGPGDIMIDWYLNLDFNWRKMEGKYHTHSIVEYHFDQGGTMTLIRNTDRVYVGPDPYVDWELIRENIRVISATGCCEGIHFTEIFLEEDPVYFEALAAHWAPKQ